MDASYAYVALLAEGVGRNCPMRFSQCSQSVALLAEGVGRNRDENLQQPVVQVALLAEGVGRNQNYGLVASAVEGRPPRGGRG